MPKSDQFLECLHCVTLLLRNFCRAQFSTKENNNPVAWHSQISIISFNLPFQQVCLSNRFASTVSSPNLSQTDPPNDPHPCPVCSFKSRVPLFLPVIWQELSEVLPHHQPCLTTQNGLAEPTRTPCHLHH